jgi:homoserine O-acetyltransferase
VRTLIALVALVGCKRAHEDPPKPPAPPLPPVAGVTPNEADFTIPNFHFADGSQLDLRIHYMTLGTPHGNNAVLIMHGTTGSGRQFLQKQFADVLFGKGQPLDVTKYFVILPDDIGHGGSSKPSDGMRAKFPHYGYEDMVAAEHALVTDGLKLDHLRLVMGTSMGCMHSWMWAEKWPAMMDAVMPLACLPVAIAGRNREWRKMLIDAVQRDPVYANGDYKEQPRHGLEAAGYIFAIAGSAPLADQKRMATPDASDAAVADLEQKFAAGHDANDLVYAVSASRDYDPSAKLEAITAPVMFVNSADDFINPPELGIAEREIQRVKKGKFVLIPASAETHGHGTHTWAALWQQYLVELLQ